MDTHLQKADRVTLSAWRTTNVLGWSAVAVSVALIAHQAVVQLWGRMVLSLSSLNIRPEEIIGQAGFPYTRIVARAATYALVGVVIGLIVGARVWKRQSLTAAFAAVAYVLVTVFALEYSINRRLLDVLGNTQAPVLGHDLLQRGWGLTGWTGVSYDLLGVFAVVAAVLTASRIARRRTAT